jgi:FkbM family methyltransferase
LFPCTIRLSDFNIIIKNKRIANCCGGLINSMGLYDPNNMFLIQDLSRTNIIEVMFDIGAYIGIYSLIPYNNVNVFAFEPHPFTFSLLSQNIEHNNRTNILPVNKALDKNSGIMFFSDIPGSSINKILHDHSIDDNVIQIESINGDVFCNHNNLHPDLLKIDTEGNELGVLTGFSLTLNSVKLILVESDSIQTISPLLNSKGFIGPLKYNHSERLFSSNFKSYEDWIFINKANVQEFYAYKIITE